MEPLEMWISLCFCCDSEGLETVYNNTDDCESCSLLHSLSWCFFLKTRHKLGKSFFFPFVFICSDYIILSFTIPILDASINAKTLMTAVGVCKGAIIPCLRPFLYISTGINCKKCLSNSVVNHRHKRLSDSLVWSKLHPPWCWQLLRNTDTGTACR